MKYLLLKPLGPEVLSTLKELTTSGKSRAGGPLAEVLLEP